MTETTHPADDPVMSTSVTGTGRALLSADGTRRLVLQRRWHDAPGWDGGPLYICLNPSTADAAADDQTVRRLKFYARREGYRSLTVMNLSDYRTTSPARLVTAGAPAASLAMIRDQALAAPAVIAAWGAWASHPVIRPAAVAVAAMLIRDLGLTPLCFGVTADHWPRHPGRLANDAALQEWKPSRAWLDGTLDSSRCPQCERIHGSWCGAFGGPVYGTHVTAPGPAGTAAEDAPF